MSLITKLKAAWALLVAKETITAQMIRGFGDPKAEASLQCPVELAQGALSVFRTALSSAEDALDTLNKQRSRHSADVQVLVDSLSSHDAEIASLENAADQIRGLLGLKVEAIQPLAHVNVAGTQQPILPPGYIPG